MNSEMVLISLHRRVEKLTTRLTQTSMCERVYPCSPRSAELYRRTGTRVARTIRLCVWPNV